MVIVINNQVWTLLCSIDSLEKGEYNFRQLRASNQSYTLEAGVRSILERCDSDKDEPILTQGWVATILE